MNQLDKIVEEIIEQRIIEPEDFVVLGLSGGADSVLLFRVLVKLRDRLKYRLVAAHINHGVRGEEALRDQFFSEELASKFNVEFRLLATDMKKYADENRISEEDAGRRLRYGFFNEIIGDSKQGKIATAHHKNDQCETILMNIIRGTGINGLVGMEKVSGNIIRPLLGISRDDVEKILSALGQGYVQDSTNFQNDYRRNKIRNKLIPFIEQEFNPSVEDAVYRLGQNISWDCKYLDDIADKALKEVTLGDNSIGKLSFRALDRAIQNRVIIMMISKLTGSTKDISSHMVNRVLNLFYQSENKRYEFADFIIYSSFDRVVFGKESMEHNQENLFLNPGEKCSWGRYKFELGIASKEYYNANKNRKDHTFWLKANDITSVEIRGRRPGDRFYPLKGNGNKKIKDYFIEKKIDSSLRNTIPLILYNGKIIWVVGVGRGNDYLVNKDNQEMLYIKYEVNDEH